MQLDATNNEIKYAETVGTVARYTLILDGEPTMHVLCDTADPEKVIRIAAAHALGEVAHDTKGRYTTVEKFTEDADGNPLGVETRVDEKSVYRYVLPRMHVLLGRLLRAA